MALTWTYAGDFTLPRDEVRFLVGDTDSTDKLVYDEEIAYLISQEASTVLAAARVAAAIAAKFARQADTTVGDLSVRKSQRADSFRALAQDLLTRGRSYAVPYAGGISVTDKQAVQDDTDRDAPFFYRSMDRNPYQAPPTPDATDEYYP